MLNYTFSLNTPGECLTELLYLAATVFTCCYQAPASLKWIYRKIQRVLFYFFDYNNKPGVLLRGDFRMSIIDIEPKIQRCKHGFIKKGNMKPAAALFWVEKTLATILKQFSCAMRILKSFSQIHSETWRLSKFGEDVVQRRPKYI